MDFLTGWRIPGCTCHVYLDGKRVFEYSSGYSVVEDGKKMQGNELMYMFSATKVVTSTAALQLLEKGKFHLNDPLERYMPEWADVKVMSTDVEGHEALRDPDRKVLVRDLFSMAAGLTYNLSTPEIEKVIKDTDGYAPTREIARAIAKSPLKFSPGTHWEYSTCHDVLAAFVEEVSGQRFRDYVRENIFDKVEMPDSDFGIPEGERRERMARMYVFSDEKNAYERQWTDPEYILLGKGYDSGGAGMVSTVADMARFADAMSRGGMADGGRILSPHTIDLMRKNTLDENQLKDFSWEALVGYGYGLGVRTLMDPMKAGTLSPVGEFGWSGAAGAFMLIDPENRLSMFYAHHMVNNQEPFTNPRLRNILYACLDD